ncbi:MAG: radical SAM protein, partial [Chitinivibrionales bacterium]|nr:radical SAM protein [Chitinivibrionales bacterium]
MDELQFSDKLMSLGHRNYPTTAILEITKRCNASCDYCYIKDNDSKDLSTAEIKRIIDKLADAGILFLIFTGGDPFIRDDIIDILEYAVSKNFWKMTIMTNGTLINANHISFLKRNSRYF